MPKKHINMIKICVGAQTVLDLHHWQEKRLEKTDHSSTLCTKHITRMRPKRAKEILNGGSLYWVFKGFILARQEILALEDTIGEDNITRCSIILDSQIVITEAQRKRPFQGWRYFQMENAPRDLKTFSANDIQLPLSLERGLHEIGIF